jgi:hypothetical protein
MLVTPTFHMPKTIVGLHALAVAAPLALEWQGVLPRSFRLDGGSLVLDPWAIDVTPSALIFTVLATIVAQLVANAWMLDRQRRDQERAQELLHAQKWQLSQLVPGSGSGA